MLQLHLNDQLFYCLPGCNLYERFYSTYHYKVNPKWNSPVIHLVDSPHKGSVWSCYDIMIISHLFMAWMLYDLFCCYVMANIIFQLFKSIPLACFMANSIISIYLFLLYFKFQFHEFGCVFFYMKDWHASVFPFPYSSMVGLVFYVLSQNLWASSQPV